MTIETYTIRLKHDKGIQAFTVTGTDWLECVRNLLRKEGAPDSAFLNCYTHLKEGERLWNGAIASKHLAEAYNRVTDHIYAWQAIGKPAPEHLLNGQHNLIASAA